MEPGTAGCEAQILPLCYATPPPRDPPRQRNIYLPNPPKGSKTFTGTC